MLTSNGVGEGAASWPGSVSLCNLCLPSVLQPFAGGGYRLGATPEEESAYVAGERRSNSAQDVSICSILEMSPEGFIC